MKKIFVLVVTLVTVMRPGVIHSDSLGLPGVNNREMEGRLSYGRSIKEEGKWKQYAKGVKEIERAKWEAEAERLIREKLGLNGVEELEGAEYGEYTNAKAKWEQEADAVVKRAYGQWRAVRDW